MATSFERWEKDPFFLTAEEVQKSTDRLVSVYRIWSEGKDRSRSYPAALAADSDVVLRRDLQTALGTAKWQLEEWEKAVRSNDDACLAGEEIRARHDLFVSALASEISRVENSLMEPCRDNRGTRLAWVHLDEGERDELARFLSLPPLPREKVPKGEQSEDARIRSELKQEKVKGHRRIASASTADFGSCKISFSLEDSPSGSPEERTTGLSLPKVSSFSSLSKALEPAPNIKLPKNSFRKWKGHDHHEKEELIPLRNHQLSRGSNGCCEKNKCWLGGSGDEYYGKRIYGWLGASRRQLQRSQYSIRYGRHMQIILMVVFVLLLLVLLLFQAI